MLFLDNEEKYMSSTDNSSVRRPGLSASHSAGTGWHAKGKWTPVNIAVMVFSFVLFWPLGLFMVFWICSGRHAMELVSKARTLINKLRDSDYADLAATNNTNKVFQEYQQVQYDRIHEIKVEIRERATRFNAFRSERKRKEDQDEFNLFMATTPARHEG